MDTRVLLRIVRQRWEVIALAVILCLSIPAVTCLPEKMVQRVYHGDGSRASSNEYAKLVDDYRRTVVQIIGGAFLLYTLHLTQRRTKAAEETLRTTQKSLEITRETQVTDRFTKAIGQLGATDSQGKKQIETRLGAIYSLERIARDSPDDHWPIMEILSAYVRQNAPWQEPEDNDTEPAPEPDKDIQAIMTVIGRRKCEQDKGSLNLYEVDLQKASLKKAHLEGADLRQAQLEGANLREAYLGIADLRQAHLEGADLRQAHLEVAKLMSARLEGADLREAHLEGAKLTNAQLGLADLRQAHLTGADLRQAHLEGADLSHTVGLTQEQINAAYGDETTKLPAGRGLTYPEHWTSNPVPKA